MPKTPQSGGGFTLVELLIVAIILAILAAIVIPQFGEASSDVKLSALKSNLHTVRTQLQLYKFQHNETYPALLTWSDQMTKKTDADGTVNASGAFGPYLLKMPQNPIDNSSAIAATQNGAGGWAYDAASGLFRSNDASVIGAGSETKDL